MGRTKRAKPIWADAFAARSECESRLGKELSRVALQGINPILDRRRRQEQAKVWQALLSELRRCGPKLRSIQRVARHSELHDLVARSQLPAALYAMSGLGPAGVTAVELVQFFRQLRDWLAVGCSLLEFAKAVRPEAWIEPGLSAAVDKTKTLAIAEYFSALEERARRPFTGGTAALLVIAAFREEEPRNEDAWEKARKRWDEAMSKARRGIPERRAALLMPVLGEVLRRRNAGEKEVWESLDELVDQILADPVKAARLEALLARRAALSGNRSNKPHSVSAEFAARESTAVPGDRESNRHP